MKIDRVIIRRSAPPLSRPSATGGFANLTREEWAALLGRADTYTEATVLKSDGPVFIGPWVGRVSVDGTSDNMVLKVRPMRSWRDALRVWLGFGPFQRHWDGAALLSSQRIATARPLCLGVLRANGRLCEVLAMTWVEGSTLLHAAAGHNPVRTQHEHARRAGELVWRLSAAGLFNRDLKPSNVIVRDADPGQFRAGELLAIIDCVGVRRALAQGDQQQIVRMLASLLIEPLGCGVPIRAALAMRGLRSAYLLSLRDGDARSTPGGEELLKQQAQLSPRSLEWRAWRNKTWHQVRDHITRHGDPRPTHNPLSGSAS